jgi:hypothetical protein
MTGLTAGGVITRRIEGSTKNEVSDSIVPGDAR